MKALTSLKAAFAFLIICTFIGIGLAVWTSVQTSQNVGADPIRDPQPMSAPE